MQDKAEINVRVSVITPAAKSWLRSSTKCRVLHVFPAACNLVNSQNSVLSLVKDQDSLSPFSALISNPVGSAPTEIRFVDWIDIDTPVSLSSTFLSIGEITLSVDHARLWNPQFTWTDFAPDTLGAAIPVIEESLSTVAPSGSLFDILHGGSFSGLLGIALSAWQELQSGLLSEDPMLIASGTRKLAGLGEGLTPAGDDFLLGIIYALRIIGQKNAEKTIQVIVQESTPRTTSLSAAWIYAAGLAEAGIIWHWFLRSIQSENADEIAAITRRIGTVGHTSGSDALAGFLAVSKLLNQRIIAEVR